MMIPIDLKTGSNPDVNQVENNPRLRNMYVSASGIINRLPQLMSFVPITDIKAVHETSYDGGSYIVATKSELVRVSVTGAISRLATLKASDKAVRIAENQQNEVIVVTGDAAYVFNQSTSVLTTLGASQGYDLVNPVDVVVIDTIAIIIGGTDKKWIISSANNALVYDANEVVLTDESLGNLTGCAERNNNLFIFAEHGIQRWTPGLEQNQYSEPFVQDTNFRSDFGAISTASIQSSVDAIFFLSDNFNIMTLTVGPPVPLTSAGIMKEIGTYTQQSFATGAIYQYNGEYFYQLSFTQQENSWIFAIASKKFSESDDLIIDSDSSINSGFSIAAKSDGLYTLSNDHEDKECLFNSIVGLMPDSTDPYRKRLTAAKLGMTQGLSQPVSPQYVELSISKDNLRFSNHIRRQIGLVGERYQSMVWRMNYTGQQFTIQYRYYGNLDVSFRRLTIDIQ